MSVGVYMYVWVCPYTHTHGHLNISARICLDEEDTRHLAALVASGKWGGNYFSLYAFCTFCILYHVPVLSIQKIKFLNFHLVCFSKKEK